MSGARAGRLRLRRGRSARSGLVMPRTRRDDDDDIPQLRKLAPLPPPREDPNILKQKAAERATALAALPFAKHSPRAPTSARLTPMPIPLQLMMPIGNMPTKRRANVIANNKTVGVSARTEALYATEATWRRRDQAWALSLLSRQGDSPRRIDGFNMPPLTPSSLGRAVIPTHEVTR